MHIAFLGPGDLEPRSGGNVYDRRVIEGWRALGDEVQVLAAPPPGEELPAALWQAQAAAEVVVQDELLHPVLAEGNARLRAAGVTVVALVHNLGPRDEVERRYLASLNGVVTVSTSTLNEVRVHGGARLPALVAHAGRDDPDPPLSEGEIEGRAAEGGPLRLVFAGVLAPHKGPHRLLEALARLGPGVVHLDLCGWLDRDPAYVQQLQARVRELDLQGAVRLHGPLERSALHALYRRAHAFALPSDREAYPLAALEALGFGLPALLTDRGGTGELLGTAGAGHLVDPDDTAAWAARLAAWAKDRQALATAGRAASVRHRQHGSWLDTARRARALLLTL